MMNKENIKALGLFSGGLDSQLAACVLRNQGVGVELVVFDSPFYDPSSAIKATESLGFPLHIVDFTDSIVGLVNHPPHGFGSHMNPCIDCHALMFRTAGQMMTKMGFDFIFTGEVLNQRPMSQNRSSLALVAKDSTFADLVLRPLCAKLLEPTKPEREGWVDREQLLGLSGRGRKPQFALAKQFGIKEYPSPAGGCRLTEPGYSLRLADLKKHEGLSDKRALTLLRFGRHFRFASGTKYILGRHAQDNAEIENLADASDKILVPVNIPGPSGLLPPSASETDEETAARILARYTHMPPDQEVIVKIRSLNQSHEISVRAMPEDAVTQMLIQKR